MTLAPHLRSLLLVIIAGLALLCVEASAQNREAPAKPAAALSEPLTPEAVRELVSRLSDAEVRALLIEQLDRGAAPQKAGGTGVAGMVGAMDESSAAMRQRATEIFGSVTALPEALRQVYARLTDVRGVLQLPLIAFGIAAMLVVGWLVETAFRRMVRAPLERVHQGLGTSFGAQAARITLTVLLEAISLAVFYAGAAALFFALWHGHEATRIVIFVTLGAVVVYRAVATASRILLAPREPAMRLLPFDDAAARRLHAGVVRFVLIYVALYGTILVFGRLGVRVEILHLLTIVMILVLLASILDTTWRAREDIGRLIRGSGERNALIRLLAELWPALASVYFIGIAVARLTELLSRDPTPTNAPIISLLLVIALPIADMVLCRALGALAGPPPGGEARPSIISSYESVMRRAIHIVVTVVGVLVLADLWQLDLFGIARRSLGGQITSALFGIGIVLLLAYMFWEIVNTAIERRMKAETPQDAVAPASRLRTLLPLFRMVLLATIFVMATLSILAALGVDILPLLAGASVVGVAIGFGSQTLVRDIVTGAFFLVDDAFRLGEYIEVGNTKGRIEKLTARAVFLRHHRGQLNVLPYGEIRQLKNNSRDWMIMKLEFRVTYDTDLNLVKKIMKKIGAELQADPELGKDIIEPLKSQGVYSTEDSALVVRAKFMAKPGATVFMIRRVAYDKILKAFKDNGIKFAHRQVTVLVPGSENEAAAAKAAAGAAALAAAQAEAKPA
ncbi:MAG: mechanosensitive ion channel, partial [Burkholderiales bacterium]|nr:mechanosensitive ion channel [Burkholderiales bacterium]